MSERLLDAFRQDAERGIVVPEFEPIWQPAVPDGTGGTLRWVPWRPAPWW